MLIKFDKMQALGNDFVMIDADQLSRHSEERSDVGIQKKNLDCYISAELAMTTKICDRRYGIGCDQAVLYKMQDDTVLTKFFNPDGSEAEICGNAARCLGLLMKKRAGWKKFDLKASEKAYPIQMDSKICIGMGRPAFSSIALSALDLPTNLGVYRVSCVSIGNPHLILFCKNIPDEEIIKSAGARLESYPLFENKINVSFARIVSENEISLSVFERGTGLTLACGSGACAAAAAAYFDDLIKSKDIFVKQKGGTLEISIDKGGNVFQTGPASYVFSGEMEI